MMGAQRQVPWIEATYAMQCSNVKRVERVNQRSRAHVGRRTGNSKTWTVGDTYLDKENRAKKACVLLGFIIRLETG